LLSSGFEGVAPNGYSREKISYAILLAADGTWWTVDDIRDNSGKKPVPRSASVPQPGKSER